MTYYDNGYATIDQDEHYLLKQEDHYDCSNLNSGRNCFMSFYNIFFTFINIISGSRAFNEN